MKVMLSYTQQTEGKALTTHRTHLTPVAELKCRSSGDLFQRGACIIYPTVDSHPQPGQPSVALT